MRIKFLYRCQECKEENYVGKKNKTKHPEKMEVNKYCPKCNKKTVHKEKNKMK